MGCTKTCDDFPSRAKHRITIQNKDTTDDGAGGRTTVWADLAEVWAIIEPSSGRERMFSDQLFSRVSTKMVIKYRSDMKNTADAAIKRITFDGRTFNILYIKNLHQNSKDEGKDFQQLFCEENKVNK